MALGIRGSNPIWAEFDLQGNLFDDTFYLFVLENTIPYIPATVYHDPDLNLPWTNPIQFLGNGTLPIDIYFESDVVYRLEFRQGPTQSDPLIYEVNNYVAGTGGSTPVDTVAFASSNQITNPQFSLINFSSPLSLVSVTDPDPIEIAPGWFLELAGTGSATITQVPLSSTTPSPSNAPYALQLTLTGWDTEGVFLRQRFQQNGMLWANKIVSSTLTARVDGVAIAVTANLIDSNGTTLAQVLDVPAVNGSFNEFTGYGELPETTNPDVPPAAYIDYKLGLPSNVDIYLTSIQLVVQELPIEPSFEQDSIERQIDHTFHYYKPQLEYKPIPSYLVGWDFALNPSQFFANGATGLGALGSNKSSYVWDQTIAFGSVSNTLQTTRNSASHGLNVHMNPTPSSFALIQYIPINTAREILSQRNAIQLKAFLNNGELSGTVSLWWTADASLPNIISTNNSLVSSITAGVPACAHGTWNHVRNIYNDSAASVSDASSVPFLLSTSQIPINFSGFEEDGLGASTATFMAIVIAFDVILTTQTMTIDYCSLVGGDIATRPAPQTIDQVQRECQYYYRKSFFPNVTPAAGTGVDTGESYGLQSVAAGTSSSPIIRFDYPMINAPAVTLYNPVTALSNQIRNESTISDYTGSTAAAFTVQGFVCQGTVPGGSAIGNLVGVHWKADARLGTF